MRLALLVVAAAPFGCGGTEPTCETRPDPTATLAVDAVLAATDAATVVDVSVGGLVDWTYEGKDTEQATIDAFRAVFVALEASPWDACVTYEATGPTSMNTTFGDCAATDGTPAVDGTVHVFMGAALGGAAGVQLHTNLVASDVEIDGSRLDLTAFFTWDPAPAEAGVRSQGLTATVSLPSGDSVSVAGHVGLDADPACQTIEGDLATVGPPGTLTATDFEQCLGRCPTAGGRISYEGERGVVTIDFDGTATATAHDSCGDFEVPLDCS